MLKIEIENDLSICGECGYILKDHELLLDKNPFNIKENIYGCPKCKSIDSDLRLCDLKGCIEKATCGTPYQNTYLHLCGKHFWQIKDAENTD